MMPCRPQPVTATAPLPQATAAHAVTTTMLRSMLRPTLISSILVLMIACSEVTGATSSNPIREISGSFYARRVAAFASSPLIVPPTNPRVVSKAGATNNVRSDFMVDDVESARDESESSKQTFVEEFHSVERSITWRSKAFAELSLGELYELLRLRAEIFVVEQDCPYQDCDNKDQSAIHLYGTSNGQMVAYARILAAGVSYDSPSIGRVLTRSAIRGKGKGHELMMNAIECCEDNFGEGTITISAQAHLEKYYEKLGFHRASESYPEDGIPHMKMIRG